MMAVKKTVFRDNFLNIPGARMPLMRPKDGYAGMPLGFKRQNSDPGPRVSRLGGNTELEEDDAEFEVPRLLPEDYYAAPQRTKRDVGVQVKGNPEEEYETSFWNKTYVVICFSLA